MVKRIIDKLKENGIDAIPPVTKKGVCLSPYVIVKDSGSAPIPGYSSEYHYYDVLCYVPANRYFELAELKRKVKEIMATDLYPILMPTGQETADYYDEDLKAHMESVMYRNNVRNNHL